MNEFDTIRAMWEESLEEKKEFKQKDIDIVAKLTDRNERPYEHEKRNI